ncbi:pumilio homolog 3-like [Uloborus diversus]|uniref:pumilio homolog 3-like n=1 Tax=Uloborus diversus TaxID=327109 RepID=UPI00240A8D74|nr:pumilio homolog 3-like [Uloborus diversus]XP_054714766.1 pumilio homolog 3-like [Uloborus diversus]
MTEDSSKINTKLGKRKNAKLWKNSKNKKSKLLQEDTPALKSILKKESNHESGKNKLSPNQKKHDFSKIKKIKHDLQPDKTEPSLKRKNENQTESENKKIKLCELKKKARKLVRKKSDQKNFEVGKNLLKLWEELRREDCHPERKSQLLSQICELIKGRVKEFTFAHDTVRVLECVLASGTESHRSLVFEELKGDIISLSKAKYGKFCVLKMLRYGSKRQKEEIMKTFHGHVISLIRHNEAAEVVEAAFNECANSLQRFELIQEFFGADYKFFKTSNIQSLGEILEKSPETKSVIIDNIKRELMKVLEKSVVKHSIVHYILLQFMLYCDPASRSEVIESLRPVVPEILHTKDGSRVAMHCIWHGNIKDRKVIMKAMTTFVPKIAIEEHGHMVLLALFDCVDDTVALGKYIIKELVKNLLELSQNIHGKKVLIYLVNPRDPHFIHPDIISILKTGDGNVNSKKNPVVRSSELKSIISEPLIQLIVSNIPALYTDNAFCLFSAVILKHIAGDRTAAFRSIAKIAAEPYNSDNKNKHIIEVSGSNFMLKQLILNDASVLKEKDCTSTDTFSYVLANTVPSGVLKTWIECNRGAFLLVSLLETEIPEVVEKVKEELTGCKKYLAKKNYKGAEILLKLLKKV